MNGLAICAGVGGIELGLKLAEPEYRTVCYIEREVYPVAATINKMGEGFLDEAPVWDDLRTFTGKPWRGKVDIVSGGFPCQPWSSAGKRRGAKDERWLWEDIERILHEVRPNLIFLENVPGLITDAGIAYVLRSLALGGYDAIWDVFSAGGLGANHLRKRVFILGYPKYFGLDGSKKRGSIGETISNIKERENKTSQFKGTSTSPYMAYTNIKGLQRIRSNGETQGQIGLCNRTRSNKIQNTSENKELPITENQGIVWGVGSQTDVKGQVWGERGNGNIQWWEIEPNVGRLVDGVPDRVDRIRANGNAVVPLVAAYAYCYLKSTVGI